MGKGVNKARSLKAVLWVLALALAGCSSGPDRTKAHVRLVNASSYDSLSLVIDGKTIASGVAYGGAPAYEDASRGDQTLEVSSPTSATVLVSRSASLGKDDYYTVLAYGKANTLATAVLDDNTGAPASGKALLRVINAAPDAGELDIYLTGSTDVLTSAVPIQTGAAYGTLGAFITVNSGTWRLRVTARGASNQLRLDIPSVTLGDRTVKTLVITPGSNGSLLVKALVLAQQDSITAAANGQARVRVVAGGGFAVTVAGTPEVNADNSPTISAYKLVDQGTVAVTAQAPGQALQSRSVSLLGGTDHTLLIYGSPGNPQVARLVDDNSPPTDLSKAKLRLVHGVDDVAGTLSLKVNLAALVSGVGQGQASTYDLVPPSTTARVDAASSDGALTPYSATGITFVAGGVYSQFVLGSAAAPRGLLSTDR